MSALDQLQLVKLADICHTNPLVTIDSTATIADALKIMKENHITCLPVLHDNNLLGIVDIRAVMFFVAWGKYKVGQEKPFHHDDKVNYGAKNISELIALGASDGGRVWEFDGKDAVQVVIEPFSKGVHRAIVNVSGTRRLLTQTDVCRWIATNSAFAKILDKTLEQLGVTHGTVVSSPDTDTAVEAFRKAAQNEVSAVAITDSKNGRLVANLSGTDLRGLDVAHIRAVEKPVTKFLADLHPLSLNPIVVHKGDTLKYALFKLLSLKVHRVWVIDVAHIPIAVITLGDVLAKFSMFSPEMQA